MDATTLKKANELDKLIWELHEALNCFDWYNPEVPEVNPVSINPRLIIEFDDDEGGRSQVKIPINLSDILIKQIKEAIKTKMGKTVEEFNSL